MRLDFSQWHPLDHWPGTKRCREHYGGWRHHLVTAWLYHRRDQVIGWFARPTICWAGRHGRPWVIARVVHKRAGDDGPLIPREQGAPGDYRAMCRYCHKMRTATEDEWW